MAAPPQAASTSWLQHLLHLADLTPDELEEIGERVGHRHHQLKVCR